MIETKQVYNGHTQFFQQNPRFHCEALLLSAMAEFPVPICIALFQARLDKWGGRTNTFEYEDLCLALK